MAIAQRAWDDNAVPASVNLVCQTRTDLLDRLAAVVANLGLAKLELAAAGQSGDAVRYENTRLHIEGLRAGCRGVRAELESHRARHGC